jgi:hypothetical protein
MYTTTILAGVVLIGACLGTTSEAAQSAGARLPIFVDHAAPPEQLRQLTTESDAVVVVRIESVRFESIVDPSRMLKKSVQEGSTP